MYITKRIAMMRSAAPRVFKKNLDLKTWYDGLSGSERVSCSMAFIRAVAAAVVTKRATTMSQAIRARRVFFLILTSFSNPKIRLIEPLPGICRSSFRPISTSFEIYFKPTNIMLSTHTRRNSNMGPP